MTTDTAARELREAMKPRESTPKDAKTRNSRIMKPIARNHPPIPKPGWQSWLHTIIFEADTPAGKLFDIGLIISILASVLVVLLDSVEGIRADHGPSLERAEWFFTGLFTLEYILRLLCVHRPQAYATSFYGMVDLLAVLPTYISFFVPHSRYLSVIRILRVLRVFRVLKLAYYLGEADYLARALKAGRRKITVFLFTVLTLVVILGAIMYVVEGGQNGFTSIPASIYWSIVTLTTVGYGDISPVTGLGQGLAAAIMIMGYSIIAVPTGIMSVELTRSAHDAVSTQACPNCSAEGHDMDARHCKYCGAAL